MLSLSARPGVRSALILLVLAPLLVTFGIGSFVVLNKLEEDLEKRLQEDVALIARTLKAPLARALERDRQRFVDRALRSTFEFDRVYGVYVYDSEGELIAKADRLRQEEGPIDIAEIGHHEGAGEYGSMGGREVYSYFTPLPDSGGQVIGMLQITRRASEIRDYLDDMRGQVMMIGLAFCALFITIVVAGHHAAIGRSVNRLRRTMTDVATGNVEARATENGPEEIRRLAAHFNDMLDDIAQRDAALATERERQSRLEEKLHQSEKNALVGRLAAGVAHELGTPLSVVDGHAQRLLRKKASDSMERDGLMRIRDAAARMAVIVQQLLNLRRSATGQPAPVRLSHLVALAAADIRAQVESDSTQLELVDDARDPRIVADEGRMREALAHLLKNARQAAPGGRVRIRCESGRGRAVVVVEDSGPGIPEEDRARVFEPFYTTKPPGEGSGLGLAIVKGIVSDYGGEITAGKSLLGGARFRLEFPVEAFS